MSNILVVDDDADIRQMLTDILEMEGHAVRSACDGAQALAEIDRQRPDCVLLDVMMPALNGHEVLARIRQSDGGPSLPVVMLTAAAEDEQVWQAWSGGVDYFLAKPFDPEQLLQCINDLAGHGPAAEPASCAPQLTS